MKSHTLFNFFIFTAFLVVGYWISMKFFRAEYGIASTSLSLISTSQPDSENSMNNGQRSILLIGSSKISPSHPRLESIWLITYSSSDRTIHLLPIFPSGEEVVSDLGQQLDQSFDLINEQGNLKPSPEFINTLHANNYRWSGYLVFDKFAISNIIDLLGGIDLLGEVLTGDQATQRMPAAMDLPQEAFSFQVNIIQAVCRKLSELPSQPDWNQVISLIPKHIITDLNSDQLLIELDTLLSDKYSPSCNFPTLDVAFIDH